MTSLYQSLYQRRDTNLCRGKSPTLIILFRGLTRTSANRVPGCRCHISISSHQAAMAPGGGWGGGILSAPAFLRKLIKSSVLALELHTEWHLQAAEAV